MNRSKLTGYLYGSYGKAVVVEDLKEHQVSIYVPKGATERVAQWAHNNIPIGIRVMVKGIRWWQRPALWFRPVIWWEVR